ncbi:hypothetical protein JZ751_014296 [Albula glossodonta]|uniref:Uncharacterized protein n=1 Tax=Albula glossodonta TaxID=121402 RepID=A0A8T2NSH1_9TELE|nr:hypothetical protein JZ751_014296 [Albula glossodonta]
MGSNFNWFRTDKPGHGSVSAQGKPEAVLIGRGVGAFQTEAVPGQGTGQRHPELWEEIWEWWGEQTVFSSRRMCVGPSLDAHPCYPLIGRGGGLPISTEMLVYRGYFFTCTTRGMRMCPAGVAEWIGAALFTTGQRSLFRFLSFRLKALSEEQSSYLTNQKGLQ